MVRWPARAVAGVVLASTVLLAGCSSDGPADASGAPSAASSGASGGTAAEVSGPPEVGACRVLTATEVAQASDDTATVPCSASHTAQTVASGPLPGRFDDAERDDPRLGAFAFTTCTNAFRKALGADDSSSLRTVLSWAWFRPDEAQWAAGARWWRCDVVGGTDETASYVDLPPDLRGRLRGVAPDALALCADGATVAGSTKVACSEPHTWRAVTTIKLGEPKDRYPGDRVSEARTREYCSQSVGAWLGYPATYDFGFTWFHAAEWAAGNRRSVCWAKTDR